MRVSPREQGSDEQHDADRRGVSGERADQRPPAAYSGTYATRARSWSLPRPKFALPPRCLNGFDEGTSRGRTFRGCGTPVEDRSAAPGCDPAGCVPYVCAAGAGPSSARSLLVTVMVEDRYNGEGDDGLVELAGAVGLSIGAGAAPAVVAVAARPSLACGPSHRPGDLSYNIDRPGYPPLRGVAGLVEQATRFAEGDGAGGKGLLWARAPDRAHKKGAVGPRRRLRGGGARSLPPTRGPTGSSLDGSDFCPPPDRLSGYTIVEITIFEMPRHGRGIPAGYRVPRRAWRAR